MSFTQDKDSAVEAATFINGNLLARSGVNVNSIFLGGGNIGTFDSVTPTDNNAEKFFKEIFTDTSAAVTSPTPFKSPVEVPKVLDKTTNAYTDFVAGTTYSDAVSSTDDNNWAFGVKKSVVDVNFYNSMVPTQPFAKIVHKLYFIHDLFKKENWETWKQDKPVTLRAFDMSRTVQTTVKLVADNYTNAVNEYDILTTTSTVANNKPFVRIGDLENISGEALNARDRIELRQLKRVDFLNTLVIRRLLWLWIRMAHTRVAFTDSSPNSDYIGVNVKMIAYAVKETKSSSTFSTTLLQGIAEKQSLFRTSTSLVSDLNTEVDQGKKFAQGAKDRVRSENAIERKVRIFEYTTLALMICIFILTAVSTGYLSLEKAMRLKMSFGVLASFILSAIIILLLYNSKLITEPFAVSFSQRVFVSNNDNVDAAGFMANVNAYLNNTITVSAYLDSHDMVQNVNRAMQRDAVKYDSINKDLKVSGRRLDDLGKYIDLTRVERNARMYMYLSLSLILACLAPLYIWADKHPNVRMGAMGVALFLALIVLVIHAFETTSFVRTDGNKKYWGTPTDFKKD